MKTAMITSSKLIPIVILICISLTGCAKSSNVQSLEDRADYTSVQKQGSLVSRVKSYSTIPQLVKDTDLIVTVMGTGSMEKNSVTDSVSPVGFTKVKVLSSLLGRPVKIGSELTIFAEGFLDADGVLKQDKLEANKVYLLFLTRYLPDDDTSTTEYAITGYLAGQFEQVGKNSFGRVDKESDKLPVGIDITNIGELVPVF